MCEMILSLHELPKLASEIVRDFHNGVIILKGDLAAGKTTLVKAVVKELGIVDDVTSPTFSLQQVYGNRVFHYDIYNHGIEHFISLGMLEELEREGLHFVEWGDERLEAILESAGIDFLVIEIIKRADNKREYKLCTH